jgi:virginiamycin B lyase
MTPTGQVTLFPVAPGTSPAPGITTGPDGNLWFTATNLPCDTELPCAERFLGLIGRMDTAGRVNGVFVIPTRFADPGRIVTGPDGNLWFTEQSAIGADGAFTPTHPAPGKIGRITPSGRITEFTTPTPFSNPAGITIGPDGNLWFTEYSYEVRDMPGVQHGGNKIGRITTSGSITEFPVPTPVARADGITAGPDGAVYFTESPGNNAFGGIGRVQACARQATLPEPGRLKCR